MLPFFPTPYTDEHFYSIAARYHRRIGHRNKARTMLDLFGEDSLSITHYPFNLVSLCARLPKGSMNTPANIIKNNSMFPILEPFIPLDARNRMMQLMMQPGQATAFNKASALRKYELRMTKKQLKFCPDCVEEEIMNHGEAFWHRSHQFEGVSVCLKHQTWLYATSKYCFNDRFAGYATPDLDIVWKSRVLLRIDHIFDMHYKYAHVINSLLVRNIGHIKDRSIFRLYASRINISKKEIWFLLLDRIIIEEKFASFFGREFLESISCKRYLGASRWLFMVRNGNDTKPIIHILMMIFLDISVECLAQFARTMTDDEIPENYLN